MKTKTYELTNGTFEAPVAGDGDAAEIRSLSDAHLVALCNEGLKSWSYRGGAKKTSDGKTFSLTDVCEQLCTVTVKGGEPSKQDKELATDFMKEVKKKVDAALKTETMPLRFESVAAWVAERCLDEYESFVTKAEAKWNFKFSTELEWSTENVSDFRRTFRLAKARFIRNADDI